MALISYSWAASDPTVCDIAMIYSPDQRGHHDVAIACNVEDWGQPLRRGGRLASAAAQRDYEAWFQRREQVRLAVEDEAAATHAIDVELRHQSGRRCDSGSPCSSYHRL